MGHAQRFWSFAIASEPTYGGNRGYEDEVERTYRYDSKVQYHAQVGRGDIAIVLVDDAAVGAARIDRVETSSGTKSLQRCPGCKVTDIRRRRTVSPPYKCQKCGEQFTHPKDDEVEVDLYTAQLGGWTALRNISRAEVRATALNRGQTAIRPLDPPRIASLLHSRGVPIDRLAVGSGHG